MPVELVTCTFGLNGPSCVGLQLKLDVVEDIDELAAPPHVLGRPFHDRVNGAPSGALTWTVSVRRAPSATVAGFAVSSTENPPPAPGRDGEGPSGGTAPAVPSWTSPVVSEPTGAAAPDPADRPPAMVNARAVATRSTRRPRVRRVGRMDAHLGWNML
jgi:hypothetical protein